MAQLERAAEEKRDGQKKRREEKRQEKARANFRGFVNFKPAPKDREGLEDWLADSERVEADVSQALQDGWKLGLARDTQDGVFVASIARWDDGHPDAGIILNCRTTDSVRGHLRIVYALWHVYGCELSPYVAGMSGDDLF